MGNPESNIHIPEPKDEFRKTRLGMMKSDTIDVGFSSFRLAQSMGVYSYGVDLSTKDKQGKLGYLWDRIGQYISDIELGPISRDKQGNEIEDKNSSKREKILEQISNVCVLFLGKIENKFTEFKDIQFFNIDKGVISLGVIIPPRKEIQIININLSSVFIKDAHGNFSFNEKKMDQELQGKTRQSLDSLRQSLETESFFGGSLVVTYEEKEQTKKTIGTILQIAGAIGSFNTLEYTVRRMMFRDEAGRMQEVDPKIIRSIIGTIGDKTRINQLLFKIMRATGRAYNSIRSGFTDINTIGIDRATEKLKNLKKTDLVETKSMTDVEFEEAKGEMIKEIAKTPRSTILQKAGEFVKNTTSLTKRIGGTGVHYMFWGVFFAEYQKNTHDIVNMYKGIAETGLFFAGNNLGSRVAPGLWKMPAGLIGGGLAVLGGHMAGGAMGLDKKMWRMMPDRVSGSGQKSVVGHIVFGGATNDVTDKMDTDLGIPGTRGGAVIYNPLGKDGVMPNVDFAATNISFGTDPREYLSSRIGGTDTHWNTKMDQYVKWSTDEIMKVLLDFKENRGFFSDRNTKHMPEGSLEQKRKTLLTERLRHILDSNDGKNKRNTLIIDDCIAYISGKITKIANLAEQKEMLTIFLGNYANILKIDESSLKYDESLLERDKSILDTHKTIYLSGLSSTQRIFAEKIFARLQAGDRLVDGKMQMTNSRDGEGGSRGEVWKYDQKELKIYQELIDNDKKITPEQYDLMGYTEPKLDLNKGITIPNEAVEIGKKRIYLNMGIDIMMSEYGQAINSKDMKRIQTLDTEYGLSLINSLKSVTSSPTGITLKNLLIQGLIEKYPAIEKILVQKNAPKSPTQGDVFVQLLNLNTEYREQKRYLENQKTIGYATKWAL